MKRAYAALGLAAVVIAAGSAALLLGGGPTQISLASGKALYEQRCAACHGVKLEGQKDWQTPLPSGRMPAPPHDGSGHTWHHADKDIFGITKNGLKPYAGESYESDMPAFAGVLSDGEITAIIAYIKSTWPPEARQWQENVTRNGQ